MNSTKLVTTYSKSLFQNVKDSTSPTIISNTDPTTAMIPTVYIIGEELLLIRSALVCSKNLKDFFKNPTYAEQKKFEIICKIFPGLTVKMKSFLKVLTERGHLSLLPAISDEFSKILLKFKNATKVKLVTATSLQEGSGTLLLETLRKLTGSKEIILNVSYNPKLLGGIIIEYNSASIDASILKEFSLFFTE